ncbi:MAG: RICIN domain-containing protein [Lachnospiraceae bacterium]|nr:RICIN domain-containing protein [Lachnospiraceae bacterium]
MDLGDSFEAAIEDSVANKVLTVNNSGKIINCRDTGSGKQRWVFTKDKEDGTYTIQSKEDKRCLENENGSGKSESDIIVNTASNTNSQKWYIKENDYGSYILQPKCSEACVLDLQNINEAEGADYWLYTYNATLAQRFFIRETTAWDKQEAADLGEKFTACITNAGIGKALTVSEDNVTSKSYFSENNQKWIFNKNSDGSYTISSVTDGRCLDNSGAVGTADSNIQVHESNGSDAQKWFLYSAGNKSYYLKPACSTDCVMDLAGYKAEDGTNIQLFTFNGSLAQKFSITEEIPIAEQERKNLGDNFYAMIESDVSGKVLTANADGNVVNKTFTTADNQMWKFSLNEDGTYTIISKADNRCLNTVDAAGSSESNVNVEVADKSASQKWGIVQNRYGSYYLMPNSSKECVIDLTNGNQNEGANIALHTLNASMSERFLIQKDVVNVESVTIVGEKEITITDKKSVPLSIDISPKLATNKNVFWNTSASNVATVDKNGVITPVANGEAKITVTTEDGGKTDLCTIKVNIPVAVENITFEKDNYTLTALNEKYKLPLKFYPANAANQKVKFTSSEEKVAIVDSNGVVTALSEGKTEVTAISDDGPKTATCLVTVDITGESVEKPIEKPLKGISMDKTEMELEIGKSSIFTITVDPYDTTDTVALEWSSSNTKVARVEDGKVTAVSEGDAIIKVSAGDFEDYCKVTVKETAVPISVTGVTLDQDGIIMKKVGEKKNLKVTVTPSNAGNKEVAWNSSDETVAVVDHTGIVTAKKNGNTIITVRTNDGDKTALCLFTVEITE